MPSNRPRPDAALLARLRARIRRLEGGAADGDGAAIPLGLGPLDDALPWRGLPRAALHEVMAPSPTADRAAAAGFAALVLARLAGAAGTVLWCRRRHDPWGYALYGPGLAAFGLEAARLIVARGRDHAAVLWAAEEGLRAGALAGVLAEGAGVDATAARRLQLAAEAGRTPILLLNLKAAPGPLPALTRWRVAAAAGAWRVDLVRCRGAAPASWLMEGGDGPTGDLRVVAAPGDRSPRPASAVGAG